LGEGEWTSTDLLAKYGSQKTMERVARRSTDEAIPPNPDPLHKKSRFFQSRGGRAGTPGVPPEALGFRQAGRVFQYFNYRDGRLK
jgi:hypothetical protein